MIRTSPWTPTIFIYIQTDRFEDREKEGGIVRERTKERESQERWEGRKG